MKTFLLIVDVRLHLKTYEWCLSCIVFNLSGLLMMISKTNDNFAYQNVNILKIIIMNSYLYQYLIKTNRYLI